MKKLLSAIIVTALALSISGCDTIEKLKKVELPELPEIQIKKEEPQQENTITRAEASIQLEVEELTNCVTVNTEKTTRLFYDPEKGEKLILTFAYDTPKVSIDGRDDAAKAINEYLGMLDETYYTGNDYGAGTSYGINLMYELAIDNYTIITNEGIRDGKLDLVSSRESAVARADNKVLSILFNDYVYINAEEESHEYKAYNFDTESGELLDLEKLGNDIAGLSKNYISDLLKASSSSLTSDELVQENRWFFSGDGLNFFTSQNGEILRYVIPYDALQNSLNEKYIPTSRGGIGKAEVMLQSDYEDGSVEIIDLVNVDENGEGLILKANGTIYDVTIESVEYNNATGGFMTIAEHWFCSYMQDNAVQISVIIPDGMPTLMVSYKTADGEVCSKLITQSGEDGSMILMNTDIEAVG